ncbi:MAG: type IV secretion system DNA-binding domain-containing protein, partial [Gemmatimonadetes bacterium]|nr:type IV secretion system DNA-binding domain-containing protein [Gemmatimonadota bacterium]
IRDGVSLTPRRELRALALPSEIMRLPNLEGYLKFPGPFPVASVRLKYVARPKAAERFVPRAEDGGGGDASKASLPAAGGDGIAIPDLPDDAGVGFMEPLPASGDAAPHQGELELVPLPGEASPAEKETEAGKGGKPTTQAAGTPESGEPDADGAAPEPQDDALDAGSDRATPPRPSGGWGRGSDWG